MVSAKFFDEQVLADSQFAKIGCIKPESEIAILEIELLTTLNFRLLPEKETFENFLFLIENYEGSFTSFRSRDG